MKLNFYVGPDSVEVGGHRVARPVRISRSRWLAFWQQMATVGKFDLLVVARFLTGRRDLTVEEMQQIVQERRR